MQLLSPDSASVTAPLAHCLPLPPTGLCTWWTYGVLTAEKKSALPIAAWQPMQVRTAESTAGDVSLPVCCPSELDTPWPDPELGAGLFLL